MPSTRSRASGLSARQKNRMSAETFAFPKERKEPLNDARGPQRDCAFPSRRGLAGRGRHRVGARRGLEADSRRREEVRHRGEGEERSLMTGCKVARRRGRADHTA